MQHPGPRAAGHLPGQRHTHAHVPCCTDKASRDCAAAVRRLVLKGPPIWLEDKHGYPIPGGDTHVSALWYMSSGVFPCCHAVTSRFAAWASRNAPGARGSAARQHARANHACASIL